MLTVTERGQNSTDRIATEEMLLRNLFVSELGRIYWTEKHSVKILERMRRASFSPEIKACFKGHLSATIEHILKIEEIFQTMRWKPKAKKYLPVSTIFENAGVAIMLTPEDTHLRDLALVIVAEKLEYIEIEKYRDLVQISNLLGEAKVAAVFGQNLEDEKEARETFIAVREDIETEMAKTIAMESEVISAAEPEEELEEIRELKAS